MTTQKTIKVSKKATTAPATVEVLPNNTTRSTDVDSPSITPPAPKPRPLAKNDIIEILGISYIVRYTNPHTGETRLAKYNPQAAGATMIMTKEQPVMAEG